MLLVKAENVLIIIIIPWVFFAPASPDGDSLNFEWQPVSSVL